MKQGDKPFDEGRQPERAAGQEPEQERERAPGQQEEPRGAGSEIDLDKPLYVISVAAELVDMHPQTLRLYERKGLIEPSRSAGKTRLYSQRNIEQLREIRRLTQELGVNLAGVEEIIRLRQRLDELQSSMEGRISNLQAQLKDHLSSMRGRQLPAPAEDDEAEGAD